MRDVARTMGCNFLESKNGRATACQGFSSDSAEFLSWSKLARTLARSSSHALLCSPNEQYYYYWSKHGSLLNSFWHFLMSVSQCNWRINQKKAQMMSFLPSFPPFLSFPFLPFFLATGMWSSPKSVAKKLKEFTKIGGKPQAFIVVAAAHSRAAIPPRNTCFEVVDFQQAGK
jgi:hypothetical protein